ncbi:MAG: YIP1 family protein [Candidatus Latescibacterota bacterium]|nr:MAG: YIP1 family protein [Candidatus Latescibacterota bacterium]
MSQENNGGQGLGFFSRVLSIFHAPREVFSDIDRGAPWWQPWIVLSLVSMVVAYILIPIQVQLMRLNPQGLSPEDLEQALEGMEKIKYLGVITSPVTVLFAALIFSAVSYLVVSILSDRPNFKKHLTIYLYSSIVASLGILLSNIVVRWNGVENIRTVGDAAAPFGPAAFVDAGNTIGFAVLSTLDVFSVWSYVLLGFGVMHVFGLSKRSAVLVVIPVWLLAVLIALVGARFGGSV